MRERTGIHKHWKLGDGVEKALSSVGITTDRVEKWLGRPCGCKRRKEKLNQLGAWAYRILHGATEDAEKYFEEMVNEEEGEGSP